VLGGISLVRKLRHIVALVLIVFVCAIVRKIAYASYEKAMAKPHHVWQTVGGNVVAERWTTDRVDVVYHSEYRVVAGLLRTVQVAKTNFLW
jgi:hypothetical protein